MSARRRGFARPVAGALLALLLVGAGCRGGRPRLRAERELTHATIEYGGRGRTYHVQLPRGHTASKSWPLIVALHGGGGKGARLDAAATAGTLGEATDRAGFAVVYPDAFDRHWNDGRQLESWKSHRLDIDDVGFIGAVIDRLTPQYAIDPDRVYALGISNGGLMSYRLALDSDRFAAIAAVVAELPEALKEREPPHPVSVLILNGTQDPLIPYEGGSGHVLGTDLGRFLSSQETAGFWARRNGCEPVGREEAVPGQPRVRKQVFSPCASGAEVILYSIEGGGHAWPGGRQYLGRWAIGAMYPDLNASEVIVRFFRAHPARGTAP